jgi:hypothetical protein
MRKLLTIFLMLFPVNLFAVFQTNTVNTDVSGTSDTPDAPNPSTTETPGNAPPAIMNPVVVPNVQSSEVDLPPPTTVDPITGATIPPP